MTRLDPRASLVRVLLVVTRRIMLPARAAGFRVLGLFHLATEFGVAAHAGALHVVARLFLLDIRAGSVAAGKGGGGHAATVR